MADFVDRSRDQRHALEQTSRERLEKLRESVHDEDCPHMGYRSALPYFEALQEDVQGRVDALQEEATSEQLGASLSPGALR